MAQSDWLNEVPLSPLNQDGDSHENLKQIKYEIHVIQRFLHTLIIERDNKIIQSLRKLLLSDTYVIFYKLNL